MVSIIFHMYAYVFFPHNITSPQSAKEWSRKSPRYRHPTWLSPRLRATQLGIDPTQKKYFLNIVNPSQIVIPMLNSSPPNSNTGGSPLIFSVPYSYFLFILYLSRCTLLASLPFLPCFHRTTTTTNQNLVWINKISKSFLYV